MGQPTPPGDNVPLIEGLDSSWNDIVSAIPEEMRGELGPKLKERVTSYESLKPWEDFAKQGLTPERVSTAVTLFDVIERDPRQVYETLGQHLNITPQQAKNAVEDLQDEIDEGDEDDPRIQKMQQQLDTLTQIALAKNQQETQAQLEAEANTKIENEIAEAKKKYGNDIPEEQLLMRMAHKDMTADQAAQDYVNFVQGIMARRPAPFLLGGTGTIPPKNIDVTKASGQETRNLVAQMMAQAVSQDKQ